MEKPFLSQPEEKIVARILAKDGEVAGTGFLLTPSHLITCAHVVCDALAFKERTHVGKPEELLEVDFPLNKAATASVTASVVHWEPMRPSDTFEQLEDIAILELAAPVDWDRDIQTLYQESAPARPNQRFDAIGFGRSRGYWVSGTTRGAVSGGWIHLDSEREVIPGCSGGPVFDENHQQVLGMLVARERDEKLAYMRPLQALLEFPVVEQALVPIKAAVIQRQFSRTPASLVKELIRTIDRKPQLARINAEVMPVQGSSEKASANSRCMVFECVEDDNPEALAHHLLLWPFLKENRLPPTTCQREVDAEVIGRIEPGKGGFRAALEAQVIDLESWLSQKPASKVVYTGVSTRNAREDVLLDILAFLRGLDQTHRGVTLRVLVACFNVSEHFVSRWRIHRMFNRLAKQGVEVLPPLEALNYDHLCDWVDSLPPFFRDRFDREALKQNFRDLCPPQQEKRYRELQDGVAERLLDCRVN